MADFPAADTEKNPNVTWQLIWLEMVNQAAPAACSPEVTPTIFLTGHLNHELLDGQPEKDVLIYLFGRK